MQRLVRPAHLPSSSFDQLSTIRLFRETDKAAQRLTHGGHSVARAMAGHSRVAAFVRCSLAAASYAAASCGTREAPKPPDVPLQTVADTIFANDVKVVCGGKKPVRVIAGFEHRYVDAFSCSAHRGDTTSYVYRDRDGRIVLVGRSLLLKQEQIAEVSDSVLARLTRAYGTGRKCPSKPLLESVMVRQYAWPSRDHMMQMWADSVGLEATVGVEFQLGDSFCDEPVREPVVYLNR